MTTKRTIYYICYKTSAGYTRYLNDVGYFLFSDHPSVTFGSKEEAEKEIQYLTERLGRGQTQSLFIEEVEVA